MIYYTWHQFTKQISLIALWVPECGRGIVIGCDHLFLCRPEIWESECSYTVQKVFYTIGKCPSTKVHENQTAVDSGVFACLLPSISDYHVHYLAENCRLLIVTHCCNLYTAKKATPLGLQLYKCISYAVKYHYSPKINVLYLWRVLFFGFVKVLDVASNPQGLLPQCFPFLIKSNVFVTHIMPLSPLKCLNLQTQSWLTHTINQRGEP